MFPSVLGVLAFDTPYLGVAPGVLSQAAEQHYQTARSAWGAYSSVTSALGMKTPASAAATSALKALPPAETAAAASGGGGGWGNWSRVAAYAGAGAAVLAAGAGAAYANRAALSEGLGWAGSHLEFVGTLAKSGELRRRVDDVARELVRARGVRWANLYTVLGAGAATANDEAGPARERTFCAVPRDGETAAAFFERAVNEKAADEVGAHVSMFAPRDNPGYYGMEDRARDLITEWVTSGWRLDEDHPPAREEDHYQARDEENEHTRDEDHYQARDGDHYQTKDEDHYREREEDHYHARDEEPAHEPLVDVEDHHTADEPKAFPTETHGKPRQVFNDPFGSNPWQNS
jgi:hypothetical protein